MRGEVRGPRHGLQGVPGLGLARPPGEQFQLGLYLRGEAWDTCQDQVSCEVSHVGRKAAPSSNTAGDMGLGDWGQAFRCTQLWPGQDEVWEGATLTECRPGCRARGFSSFHHETVGSGWPQGGSHCRSTCSPTAATVSRGWTWKSSWRTVRRTEGWHAAGPSPSIQAPPWHCQPALYNLPLGSALC